ncbi:MAG: hypothetical protein PHU44_16870, partial [Syntrophales bacterium]|nr:hypothetical protein [Syntrophales bacterium]
IEAFWKLRVPRANVCPEHTPPSQYIIDSFFERVQDSVCWANRGGGKTLLGALATWLDTVFKSECATKILGGSLEQSKKMYQHLTGEGDGWGLVTEDFQYLIEGEMLAAKTATLNGSNINILTASMKSVRGPNPKNSSSMKSMSAMTGYTRPLFSSPKPSGAFGPVRKFIPPCTRLTA